MSGKGQSPSDADGIPLTIWASYETVSGRNCLPRLPFMWLATTEASDAGHAFTPGSAVKKADTHGGGTPNVEVLRQLAEAQQRFDIVCSDREPKRRIWHAAGRDCWPLRTIREKTPGRCASARVRFFETRRSSA